MTKLALINLWVLTLYAISKQVSGLDARLYVPEVWKHGERIKLRCELFKNNTCSKGKGTITQVLFKKDGTTFCPLDNTKWNGNCVTGTPDYPIDRCWCKSGTNGVIDYVYWFWGDIHVSNGSWTCEVTCTPAGGGFPTQLNIDNTNGVGRKVTGHPGQELRSCPAQSKVLLESDRSKAECLCGNNQKPSDCEECGYLDDVCNKKDKNLAMACMIVFCISTVCAVACGYFLMQKGPQVDMHQEMDMHQKVDMHQKMDTQAHQKKKQYAAESTIQKEESSGVSSLESGTDQSEATGGQY